MLARIIGVTFGASLVVDGGHALWLIGLHQGLFFATTSLALTVSGVALCARAAGSVPPFTYNAPQGERQEALDAGD